MSCNGTLKRNENIKIFVAWMLSLYGIPQSPENAIHTIICVKNVNVCYSHDNICVKNAVSYVYSCNENYKRSTILLSDMP